MIDGPFQLYEGGFSALSPGWILCVGFPGSKRNAIAPRDGESLASSLTECKLL